MTFPSRDKTEREMRPIEAPRPQAASQPEGSMKLSALKVAQFEDAVLATLAARINDFTAGKAVTGFAAGFVKEKIYLGCQFQWDGTKYVAILMYAE